MSNFSVKNLLDGSTKAGSQIITQGWVRTRRDSKAGFSFIALYDGSCFHPIQVVAGKELTNYTEEVLHLTAGCSIQVEGELVASPGQGQDFEITAKTIKVLGFVENPDSYPISPKPHSVEYLREVAHLRPRTNVIGAMARVRNSAAQAIHRFFHEQNFYWISTPIITTNDCEGAGELFRVSTLDVMNIPKTENNNVDFSKDFFGQESFLTVSGQLNLEAYCLALSKVYTFGPTFRSENSNTSRHLAEFWMVEPEIAFADLMDDAKLAEAMLKYVFRAVLDERADDLAFFEQRINKGCIERLESLVTSNFEIMTYSDVIKQLQASGKKFEFPVEWGLDLQSEHERYLSETIVGKPVTVIDYPKEIKAFYMRMNDDQKTVAAMDILAPGIGEIIGGSQREERLDVLQDRMTQSGLQHEDYAWYLDLRRYGTVPHAGFGLGFERLVSYITGLGNVRDVIPFPRTVGHAKF
ncbi:MAG: asparagine--tRNA ligase [Legionellales bacterium]|nr:asparagine--tRNA ligase [Legionellales bacterium]